MSFKAKNLSYEQKEPAFLRRMRGEVAGHGDPDRHERPVARPKRLKNADEDDDGPTIVDESGGAVSKAEYETLMGGKVDGKEDDIESDRIEGGDKADGAATAAAGLDDEKSKSEDAAEEEVVRPKQRIAEVGGVQKKRKVGKVVGEAEEEQEAEETKKRDTKKVKKKGKAVKLSFGDDD